MADRWDDLDRRLASAKTTGKPLVALTQEECSALLAAAREGERLRKEVDALLPHEGVAPEWLDRCGNQHIDQYAADPARWPICLGCVFSALKAALAGKGEG